MMARMKIDAEFKSLIPPLTPEELSQLEQNLVADGCRDPLVTWDDTLIDGHNRYEICTRLDIPFNTVSKDFPDRDAAKVWIIRNQFGRRNLTLFVRAELALKLEPLLRAKAKENQRAAGGDKALCQISAKALEPPVHTKMELARIAGTSHNTIHQAKVIAEKADEETKERLRMGQTTINREYGKLKGKKPRKRFKSQKVSIATPPAESMVIYLSLPPSPIDAASVLINKLDEAYLVQLMAEVQKLLQERIQS